MNRDDFNGLRESFFELIRETNEAKGHDYAGDDDALANFKQDEDRVRKIAANSPHLLKWYVYFDKHLQAIWTFLEEGEVQSEPIDGRILDCTLYLILLKGLIAERRAVLDAELRTRELSDRAIRVAEDFPSEHVHVADPPPGSASRWSPLVQNPLNIFEERVKRGVLFDAEELASIRDECLLNGWQGEVEISRGRLRYSEGDIDLSVEIAR